MPKSLMSNVKKYMDEKLEKVKSLVKKECKESKFIDEWFLDEHLKVVERNTKWILTRVSEADKEVSLLGAWLHDMHWIRGLKTEHQQGGTQEAGKIMRKFGYPDEIIKKVQGIILTHSCNKKLPNIIEGRVLAIADAMAHYKSDFFLRIALNGRMSIDEYKKFVLAKININYNVKISFDFAREAIEDRHNTIKKFIEGEMV